MIAGSQQVLACVGGHRPVVVLAGAVDACKRLLVQQTYQTMLQSDLLNDIHQQLVVIGCDIGGGEDRCDLVLCRCNLVVLGLCQQTVSPQLLIQLGHEGCNTRLDRAEVVILHLLTLRAHCAEQGAAGEQQILALIEVLLINQEVLLLRSYGGGNALDILAEQLQDAACLRADDIHRAQQRSLLIQNLAGVGAECGRNVQGTILDECAGGRVPCSVATCLKGGADAAGRERGCVRFTLDELLTAKGHDDRAAFRRGNKGVMLLCGDAGHRLEPVSVMGCALFDCPFLHCMCNGICNTDIERLAEINRLLQLLKYFLRQLIAHYSFIKYVFAKDFWDVAHFTTHLRKIYLYSMNSNIIYTRKIKKKAPRNLFVPQRHCCLRLLLYPPLWSFVNCKE